MGFKTLLGAGCIFFILPLYFFSIELNASGIDIKFFTDAPKLRGVTELHYNLNRVAWLNGDPRRFSSFTGHPKAFQEAFMQRNFTPETRDTRSPKLSLNGKAQLTNFFNHATDDMRRVQERVTRGALAVQTELMRSNPSPRKIGSELDKLKRFEKTYDKFRGELAKVRAFTKNAAAANKMQAKGVPQSLKMDGTVRWMLGSIKKSPLSRKTIDIAKSKLHRFSPRRAPRIPMPKGSSRP